jgi:chromosome segregation ATPase
LRVLRGGIRLSGYLVATAWLSKFNAHSLAAVPATDGDNNPVHYEGYKMDAAFIVALTGFVAGVAGIITALATRRKSQSDVIAALTDSTIKLIEPLNKQIAELQKEQAESRKTIQRQEKEIIASRERIAELERREIESRRKQAEDSTTIQRQAQEISSLYNKFKEYCIGAKALVGQLRRMGVTPDWTPPEK